VNQLTTAIILSRTDYGEADRIITLLTPDYGKLTLLARGVRRVKSKLAGGIELFSVSEITFIKGRGEVGTLVSTRLVQHYDRIVSDLDRTMLGYELIKKMHRATEDEPETAYFTLMRQTFEALNDLAADSRLVQLWFLMQLLQLDGYAPNLETDTDGHKLDAAATYMFNFDQAAFALNPDGVFAARHIKFLRLGFGPHTPSVLAHIQGIDQLVQDAQTIITTMAASHIRS
jgi:DNA repair protein RecO